MRKLDSETTLEIAKRLDAALKAKGWGPSTLARAVESDQSTLYNHRNGVVAASLCQLRRYAQALKCSLWSLVPPALPPINGRRRKPKPPTSLSEADKARWRAGFKARRRGDDDARLYGCPRKAAWLAGWQAAEDVAPAVLRRQHKELVADILEIEERYMRAINYVGDPR